MFFVELILFRWFSTFIIMTHRWNPIYFEIDTPKRYSVGVYASEWNSYPSMGSVRLFLSSHLLYV